MQDTASLATTDGSLQLGSGLLLPKNNKVLSQQKNRPEPESLYSRRSSVKFDQRLIVNDPSAGSPTETLLRLLLPLNATVWSSSRDKQP